MRLEKEPAGWDTLLVGLPKPHVLQSAAWGGLKQRWGWSVVRLAWYDGDSLAAAAQLLHRRVGSLPLRVGYVPRGPLMADPLDPEQWAAVLDDLRWHARGLGLALLKIDPDIAADAGHVARCWHGHGWRPSPEQIQFRNTMVSDLTAGEDRLLAGMRPKTRYNIRLAARRGVTVRHGDETDLRVFHALYEETARRDGFAIRARDYYLDAWRTLLRTGRAALILAEREGEALAGTMPVAFGKTAYFLYGASATPGRQHMASYLAQWESLRWSVRSGCDTYDWWGGPSALRESDALWGVYRYKSGFGAVLSEQLGAYDLAVSPARFAIYRLLGRVRRAALGYRRRAPVF